MRKFAVVAVAAVLTSLLGVSAVQASLSSPVAGAGPAPLSESLRAQLATAAPTDPLIVFVHGRDLAAARAAREAVGLDPLGDWEAIGVAVGAGTPAQIAALRLRDGVTYLEGNQALTPFLDTAKKATRATEAEQTAWTRTTEIADTSPRCTAPTPPRRPRNGCEPTTSSEPVGPFDGSGRSIAIVDSGVDGTHPMFQLPDGTSKVVRNLKLACMNNTPVYFPDLAGQGQFPPDNCPTDGDTQDLLWADVTAVNDADTLSAGGHGTHVASIAGGVRTTIGDRTISGVATGAKLISLSIGGSLGIYGSDTALDWITRHHAAPCGADVPATVCPPITVVNLSLGTWGNQEFDPSSAAAKFQRKLVSEGVVVVWANGNGDPTTGDGGDGSDNRSNPPAQDPTPGVLSVANYDDGGKGSRDGSLHSSSSRGQRGRVDTYPDVAAPGTDITAACRLYLTICRLGATIETEPDLGTITGTSMAAPHVAGVVAVLQQAMEAAGVAPSPAEIEDILEDTAYQFGDAATYEADLVPTEDGPRNADHTTSFDKGHGLIDVVNALNRIFGLAATSPAGECGVVTGSLRDPELDTTTALVPTNQVTYDSNVDLVGFEVAGGVGNLRLTFELADLTVEDPYGLQLRAAFGAGGAAHTLSISRPIGSATAEAKFNGVVVPVVIDVDADTVRATVPWSAGSFTLEGVALETRQVANVIAPLSDTASAPCPLRGTVA